jgi:hypothetical protein
VYIVYMGVLNLRGVDEKVIAECKAAAALEGETLKGWAEKVLAKEAGYVRDGLSSGLRGDIGKSGERGDTGGVRSARKGTSKEGRRCGVHGKVMTDFGNAWMCEGPPSHKEFK